MQVNWYIMFNSVSQSYIIAKGRVHWRNRLHLLDQNNNYRLKFGL